MNLLPLFRLKGNPSIIFMIEVLRFNGPHQNIIRNVLNTVEFEYFALLKHFVHALFDLYIVEVLKENLLLLKFQTILVNNNRKDFELVFHVDNNL